MDETMRIYRPIIEKSYAKINNTAEVPVPENEFFRRKSAWEIIKEVNAQQLAKERALAAKHPKAARFIYSLLLALGILFVIASIVCGIQAGINNRIAQHTATALATYEAEAKAAEEERQAKAQAEAFAQINSEEARMKENATWKAKLLYGIRNFIEKYGYTEADLLTYLECVDNRVANSSYPNSVIDVVQQEQQWIGYSEHNPVIEQYYQVAMKHERLKKDREVQPVSTDYVYAMTTERGIYLSDEFNSQHPYSWWRMNSTAAA